MITCQYCGAKSPNGASFCDGCGAALTTSVAAQAQVTAQEQLAAAQAARAQATAKQSAVHVRQTFGTGRLPPQTMLGKRYLILKTIGRGGMAAVYQASDTRDRRVVAIKEMSQDDLSPSELQEALDSFKREADLLKGLKHRNLPRVYEHFSEQGRHYLVMDYIDGETLEQKLLAKKGPLPEAEVLGWARQLCDALEYLHTRRPPIIFRDLKPANVMVTKAGEVKLIDFGIARNFNARATRDTQALGTPGYAPPEQYGNAQTDARADIYALGATLYHLLTNYDVGKTPFALPPLRSRNSAISQRTAAAIERATQLNRDQRYPTIVAFARDLGVAGRAGAWAGVGQRQTQQQQAQPQQARATAGAAKQRATAGAAGQAGAAGPVGAGAQGAARQAPQRGPVGAAMDTAMRALTAGIGAGVGAAIQAQLHPQAATKSPVVAFRDAAVAVARTATAPAVAPVVQPRELDLGQLRAGQDGSATLTISGQNGAAVTGALKPGESWIHLDKTQFNGASTLIQVTARTSQISGSGPQRGTIEATIGSQRMYIPVRLEIVAAPVARPKPNPPNPAPNPQPSPWPQAQANNARQAPPQGAMAGGAAQAAPPGRLRATTAARSQSGGQAGWRLALSLALALLLSFGLPALVNTFALPYLAMLPTTPFVAACGLLALAALGALIGAPLAYIGAARSPGRLRTSALLAGVATLLAISASAQTHLTSALTSVLPGAAQVGAAALLLPLFVALGAALGAQPMVSRAMLAGARYIAARYRLVLLTSAVFGGWIGLSVAQTALSAIFQQTSVALSLLSGCGLVVGVALGLLLATPLGYLVRRFAFG